MNTNCVISKVAFASCITLVLIQSSWAESTAVIIDNFAPILWGRTIERICIVLFCGASIGLGFLLFRSASNDAGTMLARGQGFELKLTRIGPGVLFCLFGIAGLIYTVHSQTKFTVKETTTGTNEVSFAGSMGQSAESEKNLLKARLEALNFATEKIILSQSKEPSDKSGSHAVAILRAWREDLIMQIVGKENFSKYLFAERNRHTIKLESEPALRAIYEEIDSLRTKVTHQE